MKIAIVASGTRGDVQPYIALGAGLAQAGHWVRLITTDDFELLAVEAGLDFCSSGASIEAMLQSPEWQGVTDSGNFLTILRHMNRAMQQHAHVFAAKMPELCAGMDLIVAGAGGIGGAFSVAEHFGIPIVQAYVFPLTPTSTFASPIAPIDSLGGLGNRASFHALQQALWQTTRISDVLTRRALGMSRTGVAAPFGKLARTGSPVLYGYSRHVLPRPHDWGAHVQVTGYWFLDPPSTWTPPRDLIDFLQAGSPPVYIGFGSMSNRDPHEAGRLALEALALTGQRGVIASGWGGLAQDDVPDTVYRLTSIPHGWLFPHMAAVVHHGGAGTTAAGLRAGVPSIIIPFMGDQAFWGRQVARLGVGTAPIPRKRLTASALASAIRETLENSAMRSRAADLGARIRAETGVQAAVEQIEGYAERVR